MTRFVTLPTFHAGQVRAYETPGRYLAIRCGRRWGKTRLLNAISADASCKGEQVGWFVPETKFRAEPFQELIDMLAPVKRRSSQTEGVYETIAGGKIDFWSLENENAGRGRKYHKVIVDEAAFTKNIGMIEMWQRNIEPTLLDYQGEAIVASNTNGVNPENFFYAICNDPPIGGIEGAPGEKFGFVQYHAPTQDNPLIPFKLANESEIDYEIRRQQIFDDLRVKTEPLVYQQEYLAEFVDWSGVAFFARDKLLIETPEGRVPAPYPNFCDAVFATIDTATKTGNDRDGTGVVYWALNPAAPVPLTILDWDVSQIEGALLEAWLPNVFRRLEELARECRARYGSAGAHIEDKASGMVLIQQTQRHGWPAQAIDSKLTSVGKSERAISVSGYHYQEKVKISQYAYDKITVYKGVSRNHLLAQVTGFRIGDTETADDDILDCYCYGLAIGLGNNEGF
jgi:hypothetical protein